MAAIAVVVAAIVVSAIVLFVAPVVMAAVVVLAAILFVVATRACLCAVDDRLLNDDRLRGRAAFALAYGGADCGPGAGSDHRSVAPADVVAYRGASCAADRAPEHLVAALIEVRAAAEGSRDNDRKHSIPDHRALPELFS